jgi:hypothetical protein
MACELLLSAPGKPVNIGAVLKTVSPLKAIIAG